MIRNGNTKVFEFDALPIPIFQKYNTLNQQKFLEKNFYKQIQPNGNNLLFKNHVIKGKTFVNKIEIEKLKKGSLKPKPKAVKTQKKKKLFQNESFLNEVKPKPGHQHASCNTDIYKEVLEDNIVTNTISVQTDPLLNRPVQKQFKEYKSGIDQSTQIEESDGLIDFEKQVQPVVRVLLNKVLEESRMEVLEEMELENMKNQRKEFLQKKMALLNEVQKINATKDRYKKEKKKRQIQSVNSLQNQKDIHQKLICKMFGKKVMNQITKKGFDLIIQKEDFFQSYENQVYLEVLPDCFRNIQEILNVNNYCKFLSDGFLQQQIDNVKKEHIEIQQQKITCIQEQQEQEKKRKKEKLKLREQKKLQKILNKLKTHLQNNIAKPEQNIFVQGLFDQTASPSIKGQDLIYIILQFLTSFEYTEDTKQKIQNFGEKLVQMFMQLKMRIVVYVSNLYLESFKIGVDYEEEHGDVMDIMNQQLSKEEPNYDMIMALLNYIVVDNKLFEDDYENLENIQNTLFQMVMFQRAHNYNIFHFSLKQKDTHATHFIKVKNDLFAKQIDNLVQEQPQQEIPQSSPKNNQNIIIDEFAQIIQNYNFVCFNVSQRFQGKFFIYQENFLIRMLELICKYTQIFDDQNKQKDFIDHLFEMNSKNVYKKVKKYELEILEIELDN